MKTYLFFLRGLALLLILGGCFPTISAQKKSLPKVETISHTDSLLQVYMDSLTELKARYREFQYKEKDTLSNPYYFFLFSSPTFYGKAIKRTFDLPTAAPLQGVNALVQRSAELLTETYGYAPYLTRYNETTAPNDGLRKEVLKTTAKPEVQLSKTSPALPASSDDNLTWEVEVHKPNFWKFPVNFSMQFIQSHYSDNWYKGGESNYAALASLIVEANYDNKQKLLFTNKLEMKLGFQSSSSDALHKYKTTTDLLRMTNKLGLQATKRWYYTLMLQSWTQFYKGYKANNAKVFSDFMSPFESILSLGMDYKLKQKNFNLAATLSPFAVDFIYVARSPLAKSYGVRPGRHFNWEFGSNITVTAKWNIAPNISWGTRAYFYTDYSRTQIEWENTFQLKINKYLSTKVFLYPRFDDNYKRASGASYFQFYENFSFGLDLSF